MAESKKEEGEEAGVGGTLDQCVEVPEMPVA